MDPLNPFKWRHHQAEIIILCVRWYLRYSLSYRDLEEMMAERGLHIDHTTIYRWVQKYAPELEKRTKSHLKVTNDSRRTDETYIKIKKVRTYLYRAVDSEGNTLEFMLSTSRDCAAATRFFRKALGAAHTVTPRVITVDKNPAYPKAFSTLVGAALVSEDCELRQIKYLNNIIEQYHRFIKRRVKQGLAFILSRQPGPLYEGMALSKNIKTAPEAGLVGMVQLLSKVLEQKKGRELELAMEVSCLCGAISGWPILREQLFRSYYTRALETSRVRQPELTFKEGFGRGQAMSSEELIAYACQILTEV